MARPSISIRIAPKFPTKIQGSGGISVTRTGGVVTIGGASLRPYPSVTAASASKIDLAIEAVRVDGWGMPGDGGAALYKRVNLEPSHAGKFQDANGAWFELSVPAVSPEMIGGDVQASMLVASAIGAWWKAAPKVYTVSTLTIPDGLDIEAAGATIARVGALAARASFIDIGSNVTADELNFTFDGTELGNSVTATLINIDDDFTCGTLSLKCTAQLGYAAMLNGVTATGVRTKIANPIFENIDYGIVLKNPSTTDIATGSQIGVIQMRSFLRAFYGSFVSFKCGGVRAFGRSPSAALISAPGRYISNLLEGCADSEMGDIFMVGCGHGIRLGGSPHANASARNVKIGNIQLEAARGCALKIDPTREVSPGVTEKAYAISCGDITSVDGGDGTYEGNRDFIRISHVVGLEVGHCQALIRNQSHSHQDGVLLNDVNGVRIASVHGDSFNSAFVNLTGTSDTIPGEVFGGDINNVAIGNITGKCAGSNAIAVSEAFNYGNISIGLDGISGFTRLFAWFTSGTLNGDFRLHGWVGGAVLPVYLNAPNDARFRAEVEWSGKKGLGMAARLSHRAAFEVDGMPMNLAASPGDGEFGGLFITNYGGTAGDQAIGGTVMFGRPGTQYRSAAVGAMQFGATAANIGLGFWTSGTATATHQLSLSAALRSDGNFELTRNNKGWIGQSPDGTRYLARFANGGTLSITAAPT